MPKIPKATKSEAKINIALTSKPVLASLAELGFGVGVGVGVGVNIWYSYAPLSYVLFWGLDTPLWSTDGAPEAIALPIAGELLASGRT